MKPISLLLDNLAGDSLWARLIRVVLVPLGVAVLAGRAASFIIEPEWVAPGSAYFKGYAKNVEVSAMWLGIGAGAAAVVLGRFRTVSLLLLPPALVGIGIAAGRIPSPVLALAPTALFLLLASSALLILRPEREHVSADSRDAPSSLWTHGVCIILLVLAAFVLNQRTYNSIDTYHYGHFFNGAVNLLHGEVPFEAFQMGHGLHDSGLVALWIAVTGKVGTSALALTEATQVAMGAVGLYLLGYFIMGSQSLAFGLTALGILLHPLIGAPPQADPYSQFESFSLLHPPGSLHVWFFAVLSYGMVTSSWRFKHFATGLLLALGLLWRVEIGVFSIFALGGLLAYQDLAAEPLKGRPWRARALGFGRHLLALLAGFGVCLVLSHLVLGWPNFLWFQTIIRKNALYYTDFWGQPFPSFPGKDPYLRAKRLAAGYGNLVFIMILIFTAVYVVQRVVFQKSEGGLNRSADHPQAKALVFLALAGTMSLKTVLGYSDIPHITFSTPLFLWGFLSVVGLMAGGRFGLTKLKTFGVLAIVVVLVNPRTLAVRFPQPSFSWERLNGLVTTLKEHLSPNPPVGECGDRMFTPSEARTEGVRSFIEATCEVEKIFKTHGITRFLVDDSASWYYVRFGMVPPPTKHGSLSSIVTPELQFKFIEELKESRPQALLEARGFKAKPARGNIPKSIRAPLVKAYLQERQRGVKPLRTPLGDLFIFDDPRYRLEPPPEEPFAPMTVVEARRRVQFFVGFLVYAPSGFLAGHGWAVEWGGSWSEARPLERLFLYDGDSIVGEITYGEPRPWLVERSGNRQLHDTGWDFDFLVPLSSIDGGELGVRALTSDGRIVDFMLNLHKLNKLPKLVGSEWSELAEAVREARRLGRGR